MTTIQDFEARSLAGKPVALRDYQGKVVLIVNTASKCGFTPQYQGLEELYRKYQDRGLVVLGFPCNQFLSQEPGGADEIGAFCERNYGVSFPMFEKIDVNGPDTHPIKWNFTKFLLDRKGNPVGRYAPRTEPQALAKDIEALL